MIDVIIPIYNVDVKQLQNCLCSIISQTIREEIEVIIVDDGSSVTDEKLDLLLNKIRVFIPIRLLKYKENHGPGYARQYGIDHSYNEYIMFIDADDMFAPTAAEVLLKGLQLYPDKAMIMGEFYEFYTDSMQVEKIGLQLTWIFSKMYRRSIINKYGFKFNIEKECSYGNEDVGFNTQYQYILGDECVVMIKQPLYYWSDYNKNSITRNNNHEYDYKEGYRGYVMNFIHTYKRLCNKATKEQSKAYAWKHFLDIYNDYYKRWDTIKNNDNIKKELLKYSCLYYNEVFKIFDSTDIVIIRAHWNKHFVNKTKDFDHFLEYLSMVRKEANKK